MAHDLARAIGHVKLAQLNAIELTGVVLRWKEKYSRNTAASLRSRLKKFLMDAESIGAPVRLCDTLPPLRPSRPRTVIATPEELQRLLETAEPWMRLFLLLCCTLGLRFSEAYNLSEENWDREKHLITFKKKGGDQHTLPVTEEIERLLEIATPGPEPFFARLRGPGQTKTGTLSKCSVHQSFGRLKQKAQVNPKLTIHDLRRTVAVSMYELTKDIRVVSQLLGHANLYTTGYYLQHRDPEKLRDLTALLRPHVETVQ